MDESLEGIPQFLVGEASMNDAFIEKDGRWIYMPDVITQNPDKPRPTRNHKPKQLYTPAQ
jgi:hypothetical protein